MSSSIHSAIRKFILFIIMLFVFIYFGRQISTNDRLNAFVAEIMSNLPFCKIITDKICTIMNWKLNPTSLVAGNKWGNDLSTKHILIETTKLAVLACIQPLVGYFLSRTLLRLPQDYTNGDGPQRNWEYQEEYMNRTGYRLREFIADIIAAPIVAIFVPQIIDQLYDQVDTKFNHATKPIINYFIVLIIVLLLLSIIGMFRLNQYARVGAGRLLFTGILWRLIITTAAPLFDTFCSTALCFWIYLAFVNDAGSQKTWSILSLIGYLIIWDVAFTFLRHAVLRTSYYYKYKDPE